MIDKKKIIQKIGLKQVFSIIISLGVLLTVVTLAEETPETQMPGNTPVETWQITGFEKVAENSSFELYADGEEAIIVLVDKETGRKYWSSPVGRDDDKRAQGIDKMLLSSQLEIEYFDLANDNISKATSFAASVRRSGFTIEVIENGVRITYKFEREELIIPVEYRLEDSYLSCSIDTKEIEELGSNRLLSVNFLPYFGATSIEDEGYIFVPDGSGAIINLNNGKTRAASYSQEIYGRDESITRLMQRSITYRANLPVAGLSTQDGGFVAIMAKGAALGRINAEVSGMRTSYNALNFSLRLRTRDVFILGEDLFFSRDVDMFQQGGFSNDKYEVRYYPLRPGSNSYVDMAEVYRQYLIDEQGLKKIDDSKASLHLELWGGMIKSKPVLGFPVNSFIPLTTFDDAKGVVEFLMEEGINSAVLSYQNWSDNAAKGNVFKNITPSSTLGGKKGLKELAGFTSSHDYKLYLESDILKFSTDSGLFNRFFRSAKQLSGFPAKNFSYKINTYVKDASKPEYYLVKPKYLDSLTQKRIKSLAGLGINGLGLGDAANMLYSDFAGNIYDKVVLADTIESALKRTRESSGELFTSDPNQYALVNSDFVSMAPSNCSWFDIQDDRVPFYQIVLSGYVPFSLEPVNLSGNPEDNLLRVIETGGAASFVWVTRNSEELKESSYNHLFSSDYALWQADAIDAAKSIDKVRAASGGSSIADHGRLIDGVYATQFANGAIVIVNYNNINKEVKGYPISAKGYLIIEDGGDILQ